MGINLKGEWCVHYNGTRNPACDKNHNYEETARPLNNQELQEIEKRKRDGFPVHSWKSYAIVERLPCFSRNKDLHELCKDVEFPTKEQIEQREKELYEMVERVNTVRAEIVKEIKIKGFWKKDCQGAIQCPVCQSGKVSFSYAGSYNGH